MASSSRASLAVVAQQSAARHWPTRQTRLASDLEAATLAACSLAGLSTPSTAAGSRFVPPGLQRQHSPPDSGSQDALRWAAQCFDQANGAGEGVENLDWAAGTWLLAEGPSSVEAGPAAAPPEADCDGDGDGDGDGDDGDLSTLSHTPPHSPTRISCSHLLLSLAPPRAPRKKPSRPKARLPAHRTRRSIARARSERPGSRLRAAAAQKRKKAVAWWPAPSKGGKSSSARATTKKIVGGIAKPRGRPPHADGQKMLWDYKCGLWRSAVTGAPRVPGQ
jgi:hypothetical protein